MDLTTKKCVPCEGGTPPLTLEKAKELLTQTPGWNLNSNYLSISNEFKFENFKEAIAFVDKVANLAEKEGHHPDIEIHYKKVLLTLTTHAVGGLSENDFILAAKVNQLQ